jgi:hypothetical protein
MEFPDATATDGIDLEDHVFRAACGLQSIAVNWLAGSGVAGSNGVWVLFTGKPDGSCAEHTL